MNAPFSPWAIAISQLPTDTTKTEPKKYNPRPPGKMIAGSTTSRVLGVLQAVYPAALPHDELQRQVAATRGSIAWAIAFLRHNELITVLGRPGHRRWCRYRYRSDAKRECEYKVTERKVHDGS